MFERIVPVLLLLSGFAGLLYEVVLGRYLAIYVGSSGGSHAVTLTVFLGGLSAGALLAGRYQARVLARLFPGRDVASAAVLAYAALELFGSAWAAGFPFVSAVVFRAYGWATAGLDPEGFATLFVKLGIAGVLVAPLSVAMGATLPVLASGVERVAGGRSVLIVSRCYLLNAAGGALGAIAGGFVVVESFGLAGSMRVGALFTLSAALLAALLARQVRGEEVGATASVQEMSGNAVDSRRYVVAAAVTGLVTLASEVVWTRLAGLLLGASVYAFALMLAVVITGITLGSGLATAAIARGSGATRVFLVSQAGAALGAAWLAWRLPELPTDLFAWRTLVSSLPEAYPLWLALAGAVVAAHLLPSAICLGASFPALLAAARDAGSGTARATASLLGWNTLGNLVGALAGGFVLMPVLGLSGTLSLGALASAVNGLVAARPTGLAWLPAIAGLLGALATSFAPEPLTLQLGVFRERATGPASARARAEELVQGGEVLFDAHGRDASVSVIAYGPEYVVFRVNGKPDGGTGSDMPTQVLLGHVGFVARPDARAAFVVGLGTGQSAAAVAAHPDTHVGVAELLPEVVEAAGFFEEANHHVLTNPRVRVVVTDAREALRHEAPGSLDLVSSEPSNPWVVGVADLFTQDHFELTRSRLRPGGVFVQWLQTYDTSDEVTRDVLCTIRRVFPSIRVFQLTRGDLAIIASPQPVAFDLDAASAEFLRPEVKGELGSHGRDDMPADLLGLLALEIAGPMVVEQLCQGFDRPLRLEHPDLEYRAPRASFASQTATALVTALDARTHPREAGELLIAERLKKQPLSESERASLGRLFLARRVPTERVYALALGVGAFPELDAFDARLAALEAAGTKADPSTCAPLQGDPAFALAGVNTIYGRSPSTRRVDAWKQRCAAFR